MSVAIDNWQTVTVASSATKSAEVDLGGNCDTVQVIIPTIDSGTVSIEVATESGGTFYTLGNGQTTKSGTGNYATEFRLGGYQFIKIVCSATQTATRSFLVRGRRI